MNYGMSSSVTTETQADPAPFSRGRRAAFPVIYIFLFLDKRKAKVQVAGQT